MHDHCAHSLPAMASNSFLKSRQPPHTHLLLAAQLLRRQQEGEQVQRAALGCSSPSCCWEGGQRVQQPEGEPQCCWIGRGAMDQPVAQQQGSLLSQGLDTACRQCVFIQRGWGAAANGTAAGLLLTKGLKTACWQ